MTKEKLTKYRSTKKELDNIKYKIIELEYKKTSIKSQIINDTVAGEVERDKIGAILVKIEELLELYMSKEIELLEQQLEIELVINTLSNPLERNVMRYRYLDGLKWERICVEVNYSWEGIHKIHRRILDKIS